MFRKIAVLVMLIILWETGVYFWVLNNTPEALYQLSARYSARTSFVLITFILLWIGATGLREIYRSASKRLHLITLILLLAVNHLIHFGFLYANLQPDNFGQFLLENHLPALLYVALTISPWLLFSKKTLSTPLYWGILIFLMGLEIIFLQTYVGRVSSPKPFGSPPYFYIGCIVLIGVTLGLNIYRVVTEHLKGAH
jgi:hypothetical protein